jgi:hypothetical protein
MYHALKTRYTRYTIDGQRFKVLHFRYIGCYNPLHYGPAGRVKKWRNQLIFSS